MALQKKGTGGLQKPCYLQVQKVMIGLYDYFTSSNKIPVITRRWT